MNLIFKVTQIILWIVLWIAYEKIMVDSFFLFNLASSVLSLASSYSISFIGL